jgi:protein-L-isoaspartate(D-aspartate) O-methyltransferase
MIARIFKDLKWAGIVMALFVGSITTARADYASSREQMVQTQIIGRGVKNPAVIAAMRKVERHLFIPSTVRSSAYGDFPVSIGEGQTISQPYIVALMTEVLELKPEDKVLEIGPGSGYQAAILAEICKSVYTIEIVPVLGERARELLMKLGYANVFVNIGDGYKGWPENSPFDAVIVTCAPAEIPNPLVDQLAEGGRMVIPVGEHFTQELVLLRKEKGKIVKKAIVPVQFVPMVDADGKPY